MIYIYIFISGHIEICILEDTLLLSYSLTESYIHHTRSRWTDGIFCTKFYFLYREAAVICLSCGATRDYQGAGFLTLPGANPGFRYTSTCPLQYTRARWMMRRVQRTMGCNNLSSTGGWGKGDWGNAHVLKSQLGKRNWIYRKR